jgi:hypothetical protein
VKEEFAGAMMTMAHAGNDGFAQIDKALPN